MAQTPKNPRLLMHRDVAELLQCLPDRKFPYRIFDAASGRVLHSVDGEQEAFEEEPLAVYELREAPKDTVTPSDAGRDPTSVPVGSALSIDRPPPERAVVVASAPIVESAPADAESLPRMAEVPWRRAAWPADTQPVRSTVKSTRPKGVGAVLAMLAGVKHEGTDVRGMPSTRNALQVLQAPRQVVRRVVEPRMSVAQALNRIEGRDAVAASSPRVSTGRMLRHLMAPGGSRVEAVEAGHVAVPHRLSEVVGEVRSVRKDPPTQSQPGSSAAAILRGVLRH